MVDKIKRLEECKEETIVLIAQNEMLKQIIELNNQLIEKNKIIGNMLKEILENGEEE